MPIEFRCTQCGRVLRVGDDVAGRQAQCPECKAIMTIPSPGAEVSGGAPPVGPPLGPMPPIPPPTPGVNPYQSPYGPGGLAAMGTAPREYARNRVSGPATALIVAGIVYLLGSLGSLLVGIVIPFTEAGPGMRRDELMLAAAFYLGIGVIGLVLSVLMMVGGAKMKNLRGYGLALTSAILALLPIHCCCLIGLPIGIWALSALSDVHVRGAFSRG